MTVHSYDPYEDTTPIYDQDRPAYVPPPPPPPKPKPAKQRVKPQEDPRVYISSTGSVINHRLKDRWPYLALLVGAVWTGYALYWLIRAGVAAVAG